MPERRPPVPIADVPTADDPAVVAALADAFGDYPTLRYLIGPAEASYRARLEALLAFFVAARRARGEPVLGVRAAGAWAAVALASLPDAAAPPGALDPLRERTWALLGAAAHPTARGVSRTTETEANAAFYRALGFEVRGSVDVVPGLRSWVLHRPS